ncbi:MAG: putative Ig domain-containing protein, partial [Proteobacteria bacterium]|nr:putative Ig domain-containing protein [Pseudomonadota bacterium]
MSYNRNTLKAPAQSLVFATSASQPTTHLAAMGLALMVAATLVLVACGGGSKAAATTPTPTPTLAAPALTDLGVQMLTKDVAGANLVFANTGGAPNADNATPVGCTASANLPAGLAVGLSANKLSCAITGTPSAVTDAAVTVTVTATNATGSDNATVALTVTATPPPVTTPDAPVLADLVGTRTLTKDVAVDDLVFDNSGGSPNAATATVAGCMVTGLPAGLSTPLLADLSATLTADGTSCAITGTPTAATAGGATVTLTVTATNDTGSSMAVVAVTV